MGSETQTNYRNLKQQLIFFSLHYLFGLLLLGFVYFLSVFLKTYLHWSFGIPLILLVILFILKLYETIEKLPDSKLRWLADRWNWPLSFLSDYFILLTIFVAISLRTNNSSMEFIMLSFTVNVLYFFLVTLPVLWSHQDIARAAKQFRLQDSEVFRWKLISRWNWLYGLFQFRRNIVPKEKSDVEDTPS